MYYYQKFGSKQKIEKMQISQWTYFEKGLFKILKFFVI